MNKTKRIVAFMLLAVIGLSCFTGCDVINGLINPTPTQVRATRMKQAQARPTPLRQRALTSPALPASAILSTFPKPK